MLKDKWKFDPFGGHIDESGNIYGRGAQDMKSVTIAQLEAIRRMKKKGIKLKRTVHISVLPGKIPSPSVLNLGTLFRKFRY